MTGIINKAVEKLWTSLKFKWVRNDFSDEDKLTGTVYTDINQVAKDLTGYTVITKLSTENSSGIYFAKIELQKSGTQISTLNRVQFHILEGPAN